MPHPTQPVSEKVPGSTQPDRLADDLLRRVTEAMDQWATANGLAKLPRGVIQQQALAILNAHQDLITHYFERIRQEAR